MRTASLRSSAAPLLAIAISTLLVSFMVMSVSRAAFTDTTDNTTNALGAGTVDLVDDDAAAVLFNVTNMVPGDTQVNCIVVTYQGTVANPAAVKIYSGGFTDSGDFANWTVLIVGALWFSRWAFIPGPISPETPTSGRPPQGQRPRPRLGRVLGRGGDSSHAGGCCSLLGGTRSSGCRADEHHRQLVDRRHAPTPDRAHGSCQRQ